MNKTFFLLLVTLVQNKSNGVLLYGPNNSEKFGENVEDFLLEDWENADPSYAGDVIIRDYNENPHPFKKRSANDVLTRRSSLDKNFMRFGRSSGLKSSHSRTSRSEKTGSKLNFFRFGRGMKDNFIRFGRKNADNFIRFGRGGGKDNFIRFGKTDKNFMRFGRDKYEGANDEEYPDNQDYFSSLENAVGKSVKPFDDFEKFTKSQSPQDLILKKNNNQKERKNGTNFLRFGKKYEGSLNEIFDTEDSSSESSNEINPLVRTKRQNPGNLKFAEGEEIMQKANKNPNNLVQLKPDPEQSKKLNKRLAGFFEETPENFPRQNFFGLKSNSWASLENLQNPRLPTPFFPYTFYPQNTLDNPFYNNMFIPNIDSKRNQGGSNFIRFG